MGDVILGPFSQSQLMNSCADADVLILRLQHVINAKFLKFAKNLSYIVTPTTGLNHIDVEAAFSMGVGIISLKGGDLNDELKHFKEKTIFDVSDFFSEDFFKTKRIVYVPFSN